LRLSLDPDRWPAPSGRTGSRSSVRDWLAGNE
jgi:hypothetical protein